RSPSGRHRHGGRSHRIRHHFSPPLRLLSLLEAWQLELASEFPKGQFKFNPSVMMEAETLAPVAVSFKIGDGAEHVIEVQHGTVRIYSKASNFPGMNIHLVYSGNAEP